MFRLGPLIALVLLVGGGGGEEEPKAKKPAQQEPVCVDWEGSEEWGNPWCDE